MSTILQGMEEQKQRKLQSKIPSWAGVEGLQLPQSLALEQCSSEQSALFKASLLASLLPESAIIADFTGGLGVDSWAFAGRFSKVFHFERDAALSAIFEHNIGLLPHKASVYCRNAEITPDFLGQLEEEGFRADCIFLDPARRNREGGKVFLLEECSPNIMELLPRLALLSPRLLLKLSPMADITMLIRRLGHNSAGFKLSRIVVLGIKHEVKELLVLLENGQPASETELHIVNNNISLNISQIQPGIALDGTSSERPFLLEADSVLLKAAAQDLAVQVFGAQKIAPQSRLFLCGKELERHFGHPLLNFYKIFRVEENLPFSKENLRELSVRHPRLEVSSSLQGLSSEELQKRMKVRSGLAPNGLHYHLFACRQEQAKRLLLCSGV